jgi:hypothetical protein
MSLNNGKSVVVWPKAFPLSNSTAVLSTPSCHNSPVLGQPDQFHVTYPNNSPSHSFKPVEPRFKNSFKAAFLKKEMGTLVLCPPLCP